MAKPDYCPVGGEPCQSLCETKKLRAALVAAEKAIQEAAADMVGYCGKDPEQLAEPLRRAADARIAIRAALGTNVEHQGPRSGPLHGTVVPCTQDASMEDAKSDAMALAQALCNATGEQCIRGPGGMGRGDGEYCDICAAEPNCPEEFKVYSL